ncbi:glycosyltransferase [Pontibacter sp. E15-1]|uniref:glycosyltransferase n=1 Tax=Pontibacter sp. E15-1 TaxID=2919918 RepID=UPI001F4FB032|nr:glycosyltransferase [Pontibacter sp. E15-1]MCJ8164664.1 glycosyltransferase [Pontibacter sp. E15-1]
MRKLLFAVTTDLNHDQRMQRICGSLARHGYAVELVGREKPGSGPLQPQPYRQHRLKCRFHTGKLFYLEYMFRLYRHIARGRYDAFCAIDLDTALPVYMAAKRAGRPFIYDAHEYFPEVIEVTDRPLVKWVWTAVEQFIVTRTHHVYTVTQSIADIFERKYNRRFEVIRNMPLLEVQGPAACRAPRTILYQGAANAGRGLEQLLQAMVGLDAQLVLCGDGDVLPQLKQLAVAIGVAHKVEFRGQVLPHELLKIARQCTVGVMLLENKGLSYYYSLANKFFDYIHAGLPQVVIDFPEYRKLNALYQVGLLTELTVTEIQHKIALLLSDKEVYQELARNCEAAKKTLNWQQEEAKLLNFYDQLWQQ